MQVRFQCQVETVPGESVSVVGSALSLGSWNVSAGIELYTVPAEYPIWTSEEVNVEQQDCVELKIVKTDRNGCFKWEVCPNRHFCLDEYLQANFIDNDNVKITISVGIFGQLTAPTYRLDVADITESRPWTANVVYEVTKEDSPKYITDYVPTCNLLGGTECALRGSCVHVPPAQHVYSTSKNVSNSQIIPSLICKEEFCETPPKCMEEIDIAGIVTPGLISDITVNANVAKIKYNKMDKPPLAPFTPSTTAISPDEITVTETVDILGKFTPSINIDIADELQLTENLYKNYISGPDELDSAIDVDTETKNSEGPVVLVHRGAAEPNMSAATLSKTEECEETVEYEPIDPKNLWVHVAEQAVLVEKELPKGLLKEKDNARLITKSVVSGSDDLKHERGQREGDPLLSTDSVDRREFCIGHLEDTAACDTSSRMYRSMRVFYASCCGEEALTPEVMSPYKLTPEVMSPYKLTDP